MCATLGQGLNPVWVANSSSLSLSTSGGKSSCASSLSPLASRLLLGMKVYIDGKYLEEQDAKISVFDHGLLYGDGIFEGIRAYNGRVFKLKEHIDRLFYSAKAILLNVPLTHQQV